MDERSQFVEDAMSVKSKIDSACKNIGAKAALGALLSTAADIAMAVKMDKEAWMAACKIMWEVTMDVEKLGLFSGWSIETKRKEDA